MERFDTENNIVPLHIEEQPTESQSIVDGIQTCTRCIYDINVAAIDFDEQGVCNYCRQIDSLITQYGTGQKKGLQNFELLIDEIKHAGKNKKYDCIIGVSGGTDSSYMLYLTKQWGLRPLAVHYDNTWNSGIATQNIKRVIDKLEIDLHTHVVDNKEIEDIYRSFFLSGVAELDSSTDLALAEVMYRVAWKHGIKYVLEGHSFMTEGISPLGRNYFDGKYIDSIHKKFGTVDKKTYPLMTFSRFIWWSLFARIQKIRPFWYIDYNKEKARDFLAKEFNWEYYGGHHLENKVTAFTHQEYLPRKCGVDFRNLTIAASVRNGDKQRLEGIAEYKIKPIADPKLVTYFKTRLKLDDALYEKTISTPPRAWYEFPTYKKRFEILRPLFAILAKANLVPMSFYLKYCFPIKKKIK